MRSLSALPGTDAPLDKSTCHFAQAPALPRCRLLPGRLYRRSNRYGVDVAIFRSLESPGRRSGWGASGHRDGLHFRSSENSTRERICPRSVTCHYANRAQRRPLSAGFCCKGRKKWRYRKLTREPVPGSRGRGVGMWGPPRRESAAQGRRPEAGKPLVTCRAITLASTSDSRWARTSTRQYSPRGAGPSR
jgi:hypothetical protein